MCKRCDPRVVRGMQATPAIVSAAERVRELYESEPGAGQAHVVIDDRNVDDCHLTAALERASDPLARDALLALRPLSRRERVLAIHLGERSATDGR